MAVVNSPWWNVLTTGLGGVLALSGVVVAQLMTNRREGRREQQRYERDKQEKRADLLRQVLLDLAAYAHHAVVEVDRLADPSRSESSGERPDLVHVDLLTAQARVYASPPLARVWLKLVEGELSLAWTLREGDLSFDPDFQARYLPEDSRPSLSVRLAGEAVVRMVGDALNGDHSLGSDSEDMVQTVLVALDHLRDWQADPEVTTTAVKSAFAILAPETLPAKLQP